MLGYIELIQQNQISQHKATPPPPVSSPGQKEKRKKVRGSGARELSKLLDIYRVLAEWVAPALRVRGEPIGDEAAGAEVDQLHLRLPVVGQQDVFRLHVAVHQAQRVDVREGLPKNKLN